MRISMRPKLPSVASMKLIVRLSELTVTLLIVAYVYVQLPSSLTVLFYRWLPEVSMTVIEEIISE